MEESILKKIAYPIVAVSFVMVGVFAFLSIQDHQSVKTLVLATGGKQGQYYAFGQAFAQVVAKHSTRLQVRVIETEGSKQNLIFLGNKKADLALIQSNVTVNPSIKAVSFLFPEVFHLLATRQSGINHIKDLKGKRIALMPEGSGSYDMFWVLSRHYGLSPNTLQAMPMPTEQAYTALAKKQADALFQVTALGNRAIADLLQTREVELIPIEQGEALRLIAPALEDYAIPIGAYSGSIPIPDRNLPGVAVRSVLVARQDLPPEVITELTRILYEARNDLVTLFPQAATISAPDSLKSLGFAFHPGAIAYYDQEKPAFIVEYAETIGLLVSVSVLLLSGLWQFRLWLEGRQKNRSDLYNINILTITDQIHQAKSLQELYELRQQLFAIFEKVIIDLDRDRISPESFQSFTVPWQVALGSIRHRELIFFLHRQTLVENNSQADVSPLILREKD
jgi:TRAP transporter TAXI family solute receptor